MAKYICLSAILLFLLCFSAAAEFVNNLDGTVTDTETGLMWQQREAGTMNWEDALSYCENLELAGYDDWRLPNSNELISIVDFERVDLLLDTAFFPDARGLLHWTSTSFAQDGGPAAIVVHFCFGTVFPTDKLQDWWVRAVRGGR